MVICNEFLFLWHLHQNELATDKLLEVSELYTVTFTLFNDATFMCVRACASTRVCEREREEEDEEEEAIEHAFVSYNCQEHLNGMLHKFTQDKGLEIG